MTFHLNGYSNFHDDNQDWILNKVKNIDDSIKTASEYADAANASAEAAETSAVNSQLSANASESSAGTSQYFATQSAQSADAAAEHEAAAKNYADNIADPVSGIVTTWLADHITNPTNPPIDTSLTVSGAAADAKVAGDLIRQNERDINFISEKTPNLYDPEAAVVGILTSSGAINNAEQYANYLTTEFIDVSEHENFSVLYTKPFAIAFYQSDKTFIERLTGSSAPTDTVYDTDRAGTQAAFIRVTWNTTNADYATAMIIYGNDLTTPYEPYGRNVIIPDNVITTENISDHVPANVLTVENANGSSDTAGLFSALNFDPVFYPPAVRQAAWRGETRNSSGGVIAPENSWAAYENAINSGFDMLWVAVIQYSSGGKFYCSHENQLTINGVTDEFYNFNDAQIESVTLSDGSKIPVLEDVIKYCALKKEPIGLRMGRLPSGYTNTLIGNTQLTRRQVWDMFVSLMNRYNIDLNIYSGAEAQCNVMHYLKPFAHLQNTSSKSGSESDLLTLIDNIIALGSPRRSINAYITNASDQIVLTENVMTYARQHNVRVFAVTSEPVATAAEIAVIKNLCPDYVITHSKLDL